MNWTTGAAAIRIYREELKGEEERRTEITFKSF
jgi:hypothetical protein